MNKTDSLADKIKQHKIEYYAGSPTISDSEFDALEDELRSIDPDHPVLNIVGSAPKGTSKVKHKTKMLSLAKTYSLDELISWKGKRDIVSTLKIDGVSCSLVYEKGKLVMAKTRGNGSVGEDISTKAQWINSIPKRVNINDSFEVRGEIYCSLGDFEKLTNEMTKLGLEKPSSQRNIVAGLISRKENIDLCRFIHFKAFDFISDSISLEYEVEKFSLMNKADFDVTDFTLVTKVEQLDDIIEKASIHMDQGDYQIDGIVFTYNHLKLHGELGETAHHPRYKMAFKFAGEAKTTKLNSLEWNVSRNGVLTPVGIVEPVELSGAMISRVTLHNYGVVRDNNLKKGDQIEIIRSGEVIPKFLSVKKSSSNNFVVPKECPSCKSVLAEIDIRLICENQQCPAKLKEEILHFIQKIGIDDLSSKRLEEMINKGLIKEIPDLYKLSKEQLLKLDKVKDKLANKLLSSIEKTREVELVTFLSSLGLSGGAVNKCEKIIQAGHNEVDKILNLNVDKLVAIESFAEKSASEFINSLESKRDLIKELVKNGLKIKKATLQDKSNLALSGNKFCITGTLSRKRSEVQKIIKDNGGQVVSSVTSATNYLVTNDTESSSSKFKKAKELSIPILSEDLLDKLITSNK